MKEVLIIRDIVEKNRLMYTSLNTFDGGCANCTVNDGKCTHGGETFNKSCCPLDTMDILARVPIDIISEFKDMAELIDMMVPAE